MKRETNEINGIYWKYSIVSFSIDLESSKNDNERCFSSFKPIDSSRSLTLWLLKQNDLWFFPLRNSIRRSRIINDLCWFTDAFRLTPLEVLRFFYLLKEKLFLRYSCFVYVRLNLDIEIRCNCALLSLILPEATT